MKRRFLQPRPTVASTAGHGLNVRGEPSVSAGPDSVSRARRTQLLFFALSLLLTVGLLTLDVRSTDTYGFALIAVLSWIGLYNLREDAFLMRLAQRDLQRQARTDGLTGLLNRRAFDEHLRLIWRQAEREKALLGLALFDVDQFKHLNDRHGHGAGDEVLRRVAVVLKAYASRPLDAVARYGGDEFMVVWYGAEPERSRRDLKLLSSKLLAGVAAADSHTDAVTISGGAVICLPQAKLSIKDATAAADKQLYLAKGSARGQILVGDLTSVAKVRFRYAD